MIIGDNPNPFAGRGVEGPVGGGGGLGAGLNGPAAMALIGAALVQHARDQLVGGQQQGQQQQPGPGDVPHQFRPRQGFQQQPMPPTGAGFSPHPMPPLYSQLQSSLQSPSGAPRFPSRPPMPYSR